MVNWHDPTVLTQNYLALIKLDYAIAGIYIWELVLTTGFEFEVLRGKRPHRRTIWLYLGTRYSALFTLIIFLIRATADKSTCQLSIIKEALVYTSWAFASLLMSLRVIAIWNRHVFVTSLLIGTWLADLAIYIYVLVELRQSCDSTLETSTSSDMRGFLISSLSSLVTDGVLLISMLIGLMRSSHSSSFGLWHLLYQQCFIWLVLATIADIPLLVQLILDLNEAMDQMFAGVAVAIVSIGATRMYRSLFQHAYSTEYVYVQDVSKSFPELLSQPAFPSYFDRSFNLPQVSPKMPSNPQQRAANVRSSIHFASGTQSSGTVTTPGAVMVSVRTEHVRLECPPELMHQATEEKTGCELA